MDNSKIKSIYKSSKSEYSRRKADFNRLIINVINCEIRNSVARVYLTKN